MQALPPSDVSRHAMASPERLRETSACDREPIHIPGAIQPHGVLLVVNPSDMTVVQAAGDSYSLIDIAPELLLGLGLRAQLGTAAISRLDVLLSRVIKKARGRDSCFRSN